MSIVASDPFALLALQGGLVNTPIDEGAASGSNSLDVKQRAITIGEVIPIVFCRRVGTAGGVLVAPGATEARFSNDASNTLTASYQLVVGEGQMDPLLIKDVFQRACRIGTWAQSYNQRAGSWTPGNYVTAQAGYTPPECPYYCGTSGTYSGLTTLSFTNTYPDGETRWDRQIFALVRGGLYVPRLLDSVTGPSNNYADLVLYLLQKSSRVPASKIDTTSLTAAANFTQNTGLWFNGVIKDSTNLEDWLSKTASGFLLRVVDKAGAKGLKPLLPVTSGNAINTAAITPVITFTEDHVTADGFAISYISAAERNPICANVLWRQQPDDDQGIIRTTEVRFTGEAANGPFEQYDLSDFCTTEDHAVKVGAFRIARRKYITHTLQLSLRPGAVPSTLGIGDVVGVYLNRENSLGQPGVHNYLYEINQISRGIGGRVTLDLVHFPVDATGASVVALAVAGAAGNGYLLSTGKTGVTCDTNSSTASTQITSAGGNFGSLPSSSSFQENVTPEDTSTAPAPVVAEKGAGNDDPGNPNSPQVGDTLAAPIICSGATVTWYRLDPSASGGKVLVQAPSSGLPYTLVINDQDFSVYADIQCPGAASPVSTKPTKATKPSGIYNPYAYTYMGYGNYYVDFESRTVQSRLDYCGSTTQAAAASDSGWGSNPGNLYFQNVYGIKVQVTATTSSNFVCTPGTDTRQQVSTRRVSTLNNVGTWSVVYDNTSATNGDYYFTGFPVSGTTTDYYRVKLRKPDGTILFYSPNSYP
jgi:hypothetical protein